MFEIAFTHENFLAARFTGVVNEDAMTHCIQSVRAVVMKNAERSLPTICLTDVREMVSMDSGAADVLIWLLRKDNAARTVNGFFARPDATSQLEDILQQSHSPLRKVFTEEALLLAWLAPRLTAAQNDAARGFARRPLVALPAPLSPQSRPRRGIRKA